MQMRLPKDLEVFVQQLIEGGHFGSQAEAIEAGLWLLKDQHELYKVKREELRKLIAVGIGQADRGEVAPLDMEAILAKAMSRVQQG